MKPLIIAIGFACLSFPSWGQETEQSPLLQRWLKNPPNLLEDIENYPSFPTKARLGITGRDNSLGWDVAIEDIFLGKSQLTLSGGYQQEFTGQNPSYFGNFRYYVMPLGSYINVAPQVGYRQVLDSSGLDVGVQMVLALSPQSADLRLSQVFTAPGQNAETSLTTVSASYALNRQVLLHSGVQWRRSATRSDSVVTIGLEWKLPLFAR